ncbi:hypothetical protein C0993_007861, partial [Termitomyces sp. T159_Od127]
HHNFSGTPEQWANCLFKFHKLYQCGAISESTWNMLQVDLNLQDELHALLDEIHTSPTPWHFGDPVDPACSFHVQHKELIKPWDPVTTLVPCQQEELNVASKILKALNSTRGLFDQPAARTIGLSARIHANSLLTTFHTWRQSADANFHPNAPPCLPPTDNDHASTHTLSYINELEASSGRLAPPSRAPPGRALPGGASASETATPWRTATPHQAQEPPSENNGRPPSSSSPPNSGSSSSWSPHPD